MEVTRFIHPQVSIDRRGEDYLLSRVQLFLRIFGGTDGFLREQCLRGRDKRLDFLIDGFPYPPTIDEPENGGVTISPSRPQQGDTVTISVKPDDRYAVDKVVVTDRNGNEVEVMEHRDGTYTFTQPRGRVTIEVTFREIPEQEQPWENPFHDVDEGAWYAEAVQYVQENGLMAGTSPTTF